MPNDRTELTAAGNDGSQQRKLPITPMPKKTAKRAAVSSSERVMPLAAIRQAIRATRDDHADVIASMPNEATTAGQRALRKKHGTPRAFARSVVNAIGEISVLEANVAIKKYRDEWEAA